jgi:hypothetical protein
VWFRGEDEGDSSYRNYKASQQTKPRPTDIFTTMITSNLRALLQKEYESQQEFTFLSPYIASQSEHPEMFLESF